MFEKIKNLIAEEDVCVLATLSENKPHCSLMLYVAEADLRMIHMATQKGTRKYRNMRNNPEISLLIDSRKTPCGKSLSETNSLTISGRFTEIQDIDERNAIRAKMIQRHPGHKAFFQDPELEIFGMKVESFLLLEGLTKACFMQVEDILKAMPCD